MYQFSHKPVIALKDIGQEDPINSIYSFFWFDAKKTDWQDKASRVP